MFILRQSMIRKTGLDLIYKQFNKLLFCHNPPKPFSLSATSARFKMSQNADRYRSFRQLGPTRPILDDISQTELRLLRRLNLECPTFLEKAKKFYIIRLSRFHLVDWLWPVFKAEKENLPEEEMNSPSMKKLQEFALEYGLFLRRFFGPGFNLDKYMGH